MDNELRDILMGISGDIKGMRMGLAGLVSKADQLENKVNHFDLRFDKVELELKEIRKELAQVEKVKNGQILMNQKIFDIETWKLEIEKRLNKLETKKL
ncbi:hypothetical protein SFC23_00305 [Shouchella clausii]|uniref:hypothetical protein n=1 Tax=Shouchella clausii TaxID=79880 RepID=UPI003982EBB9